MSNEIKKNECCFVRSQDQIARWSPYATGFVMSEKEVLELFGKEIIEEIDDNGAAILIKDPSEPSASFKRVREHLGLTREEVAKMARLPVHAIEDAEREDKRNPIQVLYQICLVLGIDPRLLGWKKFY